MGLRLQNRGTLGDICRLGRSSGTLPPDWLEAQGGKVSGSSLNKRLQMAGTWHVLKIRPSITKPAQCVHTAAYSYIRQQLFSILFIRNMYHHYI